MVVGYRSGGWIIGDIFPRRAGTIPLSYTPVTRCAVRHEITSSANEAEREGLLTHVAMMYARELDAMVQREFDILYRSPMERVAMLLLEFATRCGTVTGELAQLEFPIKQLELSQYLRLSPEHVNRLIHRLREQNIITELKWPTITINRISAANFIDVGISQGI